MDVDTPHGPARVHLHPAGGDPVAALVLGHGANGQVGSPDLKKATEVANAHAISVALVEQPYSVAGRRAPAPPRQLDAAWIAVIEHLGTGDLAGLPLIAGGRSMGARVACRTAAAVEAVAVLCLAFPVHPPGRPEKSRLEELDAVEVPTLVVQGAKDSFGMPPPGPGREVVVVDGDHGLKKDLDGVGDAISGWLQRVTRSPRAPAGT
jgi:predicted alpha/beta-hydrolase family hydrolase